jgi:hypothetical protein
MPAFGAPKGEVKVAFLTMLALAAAQATAEPINVPEAEAVQTMHAFAACVVREQAGEARAVLAMDFRARARNRRLQALARSNRRCFRGNWMGISDLLLAGSLAEHLYLRDRREANPSAPESAAPQPRSRSEALSFCVVRRAQAEARAVLDTPVTSAQEAAALDALRPAIAACLDGADEARLNRPGLRSLVALALYHLSASRAD